MSSSSHPVSPRRPSWTEDVRAHEPGEAAAEGLALEEGAVLARKYRLLRTAGFGGMAQLWVARNESTGAEVCVKILVPDRHDDESVERFRREAYAAARLSHRAIVRIFDLIELGPTGEVVSDGKISALAIVMELLHGETLADLLMKREKLPLEEALDVAIPFLSALAHAHRAGVVHRDIKPDNIFLATDPDGQVIPKVLDFGVSKLQETRSITRDGVMLGTPSFMSPEQAKGARNIDARSDVFSAGIVLYMMLSGKNPFESESFHSVVSAIIEREVPPIPGVPGEVWAILDRALKKDPAARFNDATELGIALRRVVGRPSTTDAGLPSSPYVRASFHSATSFSPIVPPTSSPTALEPTDPPRSPESSAPPDHVPLRKPALLPIAVGIVALGVVVAVVAIVRALASGGEAAPSAAASPNRGSPVPSAAAATAVSAPEAASPQASTAVRTEAGSTAAPPPSAAARPRPPALAPPSTSSKRTRHEIARDPGF